MISFVESPQFTRQVIELLTEDDYRAFQLDLAARPEQGNVIPGLRGLRKTRLAAKGKGTRGGARVIYLHLPHAGIVFLFSIYTKGDLTDLTTDQKKRLLIALETIKHTHHTP